MIRSKLSIISLLLLCLPVAAIAQDFGSVRGIVYDQDFDLPLPEAQVTILETGQKVSATIEGNYVFDQVEVGTYTLVFAKPGFTRQVKPDVVVSAGSLTEVNGSLSGEITDMEEFVVQDIQFLTDTDTALLQLRMESPALMDSISADLMSQAGASDAASALNLVAGATTTDGKYASVRGLPDRYVNSQLNGIRLPTADEDKRAVQLDLFPSAVIESIQVSKTFTPDQQGDASGGAVNVVMKGIPEETSIDVDISSSYNTQAGGNDNFLTSRGGGVNTWGKDDGSRDIQDDLLGQSWEGAVGVTTDEAPIDYKWTITAGGKHELTKAIKLGGLVSFFYEKDSSYYDGGTDDKYWVEKPGGPMTPQYSQGTPQQEDFKTSLFDITRGSQEVRWGNLSVLGIETENHKINFTYLFTRVAEDIATLAEDTRGKEYFFPGYDRNDPSAPGNQARDAAPYIRTETLQYTERTAETFQLAGEHTLPTPEIPVWKILKILRPVLDWSVSKNTAELYQPDKRQFGSLWLPGSASAGFPPFVPPFTRPEEHRPFKPAANFTIGNLQRIWKEIIEESDQYAVNMRFPFEQWTGNEGYIKFGIFKDDVIRTYEQQSFSNFNDNSASFMGTWEDYWSESFSEEDHPITAADIDVNYVGEQSISAWYWMVDLPLTSFLKVIGGARYEKTELSIINEPEADVTWVPPGATGPVMLNPGDADVDFVQHDVLPSIGLVLTPHERVTLRASYSETVARQTFKELTPIQQQEFLGGDVFIGNPNLMMSAVKNYDLRLDFTPFDGGLISVSYFKKEIENPIEYVQRLADFIYTTPVNFPEGELSGFELEFRQDMGQLWEKLEGLTLGANGTIIESEVLLPDEEAALFEQENIAAPGKTRDMTNAPEFLYNLFMIYDLDRLRIPGTQISIFYTVRGDALIAGAAQSDGNFIPSVYEKEYGTLNVSLSKKLGENGKIKFSAKNILDPAIETVYRSEYIDKDVTKTSYQKGMEFSLGVSYGISRHSSTEEEDGKLGFDDFDYDDTDKDEEPELIDHEQNENGEDKIDDNE